MRQRFILLVTFLLCSTFLFSQQKDSLYTKETSSFDFDQPQDLEPIIFTGQYNPQKVNRAIFEVEVVTQQDIQRMAGNTLDDVLKQNLNLNVIPNSGEGRSGLEQFGFNSEYIKILVDGVPLIGDEGFGNAIDISQINLDDIEQIEIVEGAMGVQYGANAVTGVINIITKKESDYRWQLTPYLQEETIGSEYNWSDQGRHIRGLKVGHQFKEHWYAETAFEQNEFMGLSGSKNGKHYFNPDKGSDRSRGYDWLPKAQHHAKALLHYRRDNLRAFYKFEYFHEQTDKFADRVNLNRQSATATVHPTATDEIFRSQRLYHRLNLNGKLKQRMNYDLSFSFQDQKRNQETFTRHLKTWDKTNVQRHDYNTRQGFFSRGTLNHLLNSSDYNFEIGYEVNTDKGTASGLSEQNASTDKKTNHLGTYSGFVSAELNPSKRLAFRPGFRYIHTDQFSDQYALSFSGKYRFNNDYQLRMVVGTSPKLPNFEQLYFYLVDSNHNIRGNENLTPEKGKSIFLHFKRDFHLKDNRIHYQPKISGWFLDVNDKIDLIITNPSPLTYEYHNIDKYQTWGWAFRNQLRFRHLSLNFGVSFNGESKQLKSEGDYDDRFLYSLQANANLSYEIPKWNALISTYFKYNGKQAQFISDVDENGNTQFFKDRQEGYGWLDASVQKYFFDKKFTVTLGARNLLDITEIKSYSDTGVHGTGGNALLMGYGRSYFLKLMYNLNF